MKQDVSQNVGIVGHLHNLVCEHPDFEVLSKPTTDLYCFRYVPNSLAERRDEHEIQSLLDRLNQEIVQNVQDEGFSLVNTQVDGRIAMRISISSDRTFREVVEATFEAIARLGRLLTKKQLSSSYELHTDLESMSC